LGHGPNFFCRVEFSTVSVVDLQLDSREGGGVLTEAMNNGTQETRGFRQVQASLRIITLRHVCVVV
jgi:hypothetical protein